MIPLEKDQAELKAFNIRIEELQVCSTVCAILDAAPYYAVQY